MTPVLKKGDKEFYENYRPVSCLPAAAKLLELVVCQQTSIFMEENDLLPKSQHGFRKMRSTMTALTEVQKQWAVNSEKKEKTGILMWDLSAAFDCLDIDILCEKLRIYLMQQKLESKSSFVHYLFKMQLLIRSFFSHFLIYKRFIFREINIYYY